MPSSRARAPRVDVHVHYIPPSLAGVPGGPVLHVEKGAHAVEIGGRRARVGAHDIASIEDALETALGRGIDHLLVSPWVELLGDAFDSDPQALEMCRRQNHELAALRGSVTALGTVPMRTPAVAAAELRRALDLGLRGVEVTARVKGTFLGDEAFEPFWHAAERLGALVFVHPNRRDLSNSTAGSYFLWNSVGNPLETALTAAHMVMAGVMERHPELTVLLAHGGGAAVQLRGRLDHAWTNQPEARSRLGEAPSASLRRFLYDTAVYDAAVLRHLVDFAGADRVLLGTDHPFDMADPDPIALVCSAGLGEDTERAILGGNAARLLGFDA